MEGQYRAKGASAALHAIDALGTHAFWNDARYFPEALAYAAEFFRDTLR
jgi:hypothetical protein